MAKFRLLCAHYLPDDKYLLGDKETEHLGEHRGTVVGDGTEHRIDWPTTEMEPLDDDAREMLEKEKKRLEMDAGMMNPVEHLPLNNLDSYEKDYVPGTNVRRRPMREHGAPVRA